MSVHELLTTEEDSSVLRAIADHLAAGAEVLRRASARRGWAETVAAGDEIAQSTWLATGLRSSQEGLDRAHAALAHATAAEEIAARAVEALTGSVPNDVDIDAPEPIRTAEQMDQAALVLRQHATSLDVRNATPWAA